MTIYIIIGLALFGTLFYFGYRKKDIGANIVVNDYTPVESETTKFEEELLYEINEYRLSLNLNFVYPEELSRNVAEIHVKNMITLDKVSHDDFNDRVIVLLTNGAHSVGENVGYGFTTARGFLNGYINSEPHKKILEGRNYTHIGVRALKDSNNRYYNALLFVEF